MGKGVARDLFDSLASIRVDSLVGAVDLLANEKQAIGVPLIDRACLPSGKKIGRAIQSAAAKRINRGTDGAAGAFLDQFAVVLQDRLDRPQVRSARVLRKDRACDQKGRGDQCGDDQQRAEAGRMEH